MNVLFEDDGQLKAGAVLADNDASLQVEAVSGKRLKIKAAHVLLRFASPGRRRRAGRGAEARGGTRPRVPVGGERRRRVRLRRPRARVLRRRSRRPRRPRPSRCCCTRRRCTSTRRARAATGRRRRTRCARRSRRSSARRARREQIAAWTAELAAQRLPDALRAEAVDAAVQARQERARVEGARRGVRRAEDQPGRAAGRVRRDSVDARLSTSTASWPRRFRRAPRSPTGARCRALPELPTADAARVLDRRRDDDRDRRRVLGARAAQRQLRDRHPHRVPGAGASRAAARSTRIARARLSTVYMPGRKLTMLPERGDRRVHAAGRHGAARAVARTSRSPPTACRSRHETRVQRVPIAANLRLDAVGDAFANDAAVARRSAVDARAARAVEARAAPVGAARQERRQPHRLQLLRRLGAPAPDGRVAIVPRERGSPLDKLISELMIHVNNTWGRQLAEHKARGPLSRAGRRAR